jgi:AraC family transcriptional regulator, positive regulator of tynA and feaB
MVSISTDGVPARERVEFWTDLVSRHVTPMLIEPAGDRPLRGEVEVRMIGALAVAKVSGVGIHASHRRAQVARARGHLYAACVHLGGEALIDHRGERIAFKPGDVFITDSRQEFALDLERTWRHLVVSLPTEWIDGRVSRPERLSGAILRDQPLARLWASHLSNGFALAGELSQSAASLLARHSVELLAQALEEAPGDRPAPSDVWRVGTYLQARRVIALRFSQSALTPDLTRTLARIFAERGETVMRCVFAERVRRAAALLASPRAADRSVTDIALACGFSDSSHFGRVFVAQLHVTPSEWRRRGQGSYSQP